MAKTEKYLKQAKKIQDKMVGSIPTITEENYQSTLGSALNYHNSYSDVKALRKELIKYLKENDLKDYIRPVSDATDFEVRQISILAFHLLRGEYVAEKHMTMISDTLSTIAEKYKVEPKKSIADPNKRVISIDQRVYMAAVRESEVIEDAIEKFLETKTTIDFSAKAALTGQSPAVCKKILSFYEPILEELKEVLEGKDPQLVEGYGNFNKTQLKRYIRLMESIVEDVRQLTVTQTKTRTRKAPPASKVIARLKYAKESEGFTSVDPKKLIAAKEVFIYNTKYRRLTRYLQADASGLTVKGTSIIGYSASESMTKTLRKPEEQLKKLDKKSLLTTIQQATTKAVQANGRVNEDCVILAVF